MKNKIASVVVLFYPAERVITTIASLSLDCSKVIVVVNYAGEDFLERVVEINGVVVLNNCDNVGLAKAFNIGLQYAFESCTADYVVLFDQDSLPPRGLIGGLVEEFCGARVNNIACIGPRLVDQKAGNSFYGVNNAQDEISKPRSIPSSGTVISKEAFMSVGPMLESLFIDGVDHEWCFRAYSKGFVVKVSDHLEMIHNMGDLGINFFGEFKPIHLSPIRHYYIIRNAIYLSRLSYLPIGWRALEILKTLRRCIVYLIVSRDRWKTICSIYYGVIDGLNRRMGALSELHPNI